MDQRKASAAWHDVVNHEAQALERRFAGSKVRVLVLDAATGERVASYGTISEPLPTGSTLKPLTVLAALRVGLALDTVVDCPSEVALGDELISDFKPHGPLSLAQIVARSSNVGIVQIAKRMPLPELHAEVRRLVPIQPRLRFDDSEPVKELIGFTSRLALEDLARGYLALVEDPKFGPAMMRMLVDAVEPSGTGDAARVDDVFVAGKTGTAGHGERHDALFVGFAGAPHERMLVAISVGELEPPGYGGTIAAPAFARMVKAMLG